MLKKTIKFKFFLFILILIILFAAYYLYNQEITLLKIIDYKENNIIWEAKTVEGDKFTIKYLHSVAKTPVLEIFEITNGEIVLISTEYQSYGAGLPFLNEHQYILEDNKFIIREINKELPEILLRVSDYALHEFIFKNKVYKLYELVKDETLLEISTEKNNNLYYYKREVKGWLNQKTKNILKKTNF
jgi:hypothetical protein